MKPIGRNKKLSQRQYFKLRRFLYSTIIVLLTIQLFVLWNYAYHQRDENIVVYDENEQANAKFKVSNNSIDNNVIFNTSFGKKNEHLNNKSPVRATIAYAISITSCSQGDIIADAAAVLKHSIHLSSYPSNKQSKYNYQMVAFVHPEATACIPPLQILNYEIHIKDTPIDVSQIRGDFLRENVQQTGCCGEKEYLKLYAYTLVNYKIVVHLDLDSLILQPLDDLFDSMLLDGDDKKISDRKIPVMHGNHVPEKVEAYFTRDYNMANLGKQYINIQGGFLVIRPNLQYFEEYKEAILEGDFRKGAGWKNKYGGYFGAQQIQGLCSYFFDGLHPGTAVELNRCYYNAMNDNPRKARRKDNVEICRDNRDNCEDCRETDFSKIKSVHFTLCQKPWTCPIYLVKRPGLCREYHKNWFRIRQDFERLENILEVSSEEMDTFRGNCKGPGNGNYIPINFTKN